MIGLKPMVFASSLLDSNLSADAQGLKECPSILGILGETLDTPSTTRSVLCVSQEDPRSVLGA